MDKLKPRKWKPRNTRLLIFLGIAASVIWLGSLVAWAGTPILTDRSISDAIEDEYSRDAAVPHNEIDVMTLNGIVTLNGTVDNILAKERAVRIAETVRGVRSIVNEILVVPPSRPDSAIIRDVKNAILLDPATETYKIDIKVEKGVVTLSGKVDSFSEKMLAEKVVKRVKGVTAVKNQMNVVYKSKRSGPEIRGEVRQRLRWDAMIDDGLIHVDVKKGKVRLQGIVGSAAEKRIAITNAWISGVRSVDASGLQVARWARDPDLRKDKYIPKSDEEIRQAVKDALMYDLRLAPFSQKIKVEVKDHVVTLRGRVNHLLAKRSAAQDARNTVGVWSVKNRLKVAFRDGIKDVDILDNIRQEIDRSPIPQLSQIKVNVINGVAYLDGNVDTYFLKIRAETIASRVKGVKDIRNRINVRTYGEVASYRPYVDRWDPYDSPWYDTRQVYTYQTKNDSKIREQIKSEIWWSPFVDADDVEVSVKNGVATLTGTVDSVSEYRSAMENALEGGAYRVENKLKIRSFQNPID